MTTTVSDDLQHELEKAKRRIAQLETEVMQSMAEADKRTIESHLRLAAFQAGSVEAPPGKDRGPIDEAVADAMREGTWKVDSRGKLLRVREDGQWDMTTDGQYISALSWMRQHAQKRPTFFPNAQPSSSSGTSSSPAPQGNAGSGNPWTAAAWDTTVQGHFIRDHGMAAARAMADAAGVDVNATRPAAASASRYSRDDPQNPWSASGWNPSRQQRMLQINTTESRIMAAAAGSSLFAIEPPKPAAE